MATKGVPITIFGNFTDKTAKIPTKRAQINQIRHPLGKKQELHARARVYIIGVTLYAVLRLVLPTRKNGSSGGSIHTAGGASPCQLAESIKKSRFSTQANR